MIFSTSVLLENEEELFEDLVSLIWSSTFELTHVLLYCEYQGGVLYCIRNKGEYKTRWWGALLSSFWHKGFQKIWLCTYYYTVVMIIIELLVNTRNGAIHQFLEREGWINDATWDNQTGIGSGRMEGWLSYHMMVDQEEKTFGSVASLATGLTSAPSLICCIVFLVL